ncbi:hypothetical protein ACCT09_46310, partial [Rhizobium ruizarguesonis]
MPASRQTENDGKDRNRNRVFFQKSRNRHFVFHLLVLLIAPFSLSKQQLIAIIRACGRHRLHGLFTAEAACQQSPMVQRPCSILIRSIRP